MAIYTLLTLGTTVVGGPFVGWVCQHWSPRTGLAFAGCVDDRRRDACSPVRSTRKRHARGSTVAQPAALTVD